MASCCTGVTECQHLITIGFLNTFIGNDVQDINGSPVTIVGDSSYCPTYSELTGGTLIQNWKAGTTPNGDTDGIVIGGSYAANECVNRDDISIKYTRFKEFSISASPLILEACGGTSTLSFVHKYDRYTKTFDSTCEAAAEPSVEVVSDTESSEVTYASTDSDFSISNGIVSVGKNNPGGNGRSNDRSASIIGTVGFRGTNHTHSVTLSQNGLTGSYEFWFNNYKIYNNRVVCTGGNDGEFGCAGGSYGATAYHERDDWKIYRWKDECGAYYDDDINESPVTTSTITYDTYSGSFGNITSTGGENTDYKSWPGYGACSWHQYCIAPTDCDSYNEFGIATATGTLPCTGGSVSLTANVPYTSHTRHLNSENVCIDVTAEATSSVTISVDAECNSSTSQKIITGTKNHINYTITQDAGPCCLPSRTYSYATVYIPCNKAENLSINTTYTATTTDSCCHVTYPTGTTSNYSVNVGCNSGAERELSAAEKGNAPFTVIQRGGCQCECVSNCNSLVILGSNVASFGCNSEPKQINYRLDCTGEHGVSNVAIAGVDTSHYNAVLTTTSVDGYITITPIGTLPADYSHTFYVTYDTASESGCSKEIIVTSEDTSDEYNVNISHDDMTSGNIVTFKDYGISINITKK